MINVDELNDDVKTAIAYRLGYRDDEDISLYFEQIADMSVEELFEAYCEWHGGLRSWSHTLIRVINNIRECNMSEPVVVERPKYGILAKAFNGKELPLKVMESQAGYYIGTSTVCGQPVSRESKEYYDTCAEAVRAFHHGTWTQRESV